MKSLDELYKEVQENEELKKEFVAAFKEGKVEEFLKANDCDASASDVMAFLNSQRDEAASEDDLAKVAGGFCSNYTKSTICYCYSNNQNGSRVGVC